MGSNIVNTYQQRILDTADCTKEPCVTYHNQEQHQLHNILRVLAYKFQKEVTLWSSGAAHRGQRGRGMFSACTSLNSAKINNYYSFYFMQVRISKLFLVPGTVSSVFLWKLCAKFEGENLFSLRHTTSHRCVYFWTPVPLTINFCVPLCVVRGNFAGWDFGWSTRLSGK